MKLRLAAIALIVVGIGAIVLVVVGPKFGSSPNSQYITSTVSTGSISSTATATGTIAASTVYGLKFGSAADIVSTVATTSGAGGSTSNSSGASSLTWPVQTVSVKVGATVTKGTVLATADSTAAQLALASAQATLASAQSKLATDQGGPTALTLAQAKNQLNQSYSSYQQAIASRTNTNQQNALKLSQAQAAVTVAQDAVNGDPTNQQLQSQLATAQQSLASTKLSVNQSNQQAAQQVSSASLNYQAAKLQYQSQTASASTATIQADQAQVRLPRPPRTPTSRNGS